MLLVIEDRDDPAGGIAVDCDMPGGSALAFIPAIRVFFEEEPAEDRPSSSAPMIALYREAMLRTGWPAPDPAKGPAENGAGKLSQKA